jgi:tellurite resistance protein TerC
VGTPLLWAAFLVGVVIVVAIDLLLNGGKSVSPKKAAAWTGVWVSLSLGFAGVLFWLGGWRAAGPFLTAYVMEYALSVDNLFVFVLVFGFFKVSPAAQHRLLYWGIIGAFVMRGALIYLGTALVGQFEWLLYLFGGFLLYTAGKLLFSGGGGDEEVDPEANVVLKLARRVLPVSTKDHGLAFFALENGRRLVTPLFLALLVVETTDLLFALDSIPAVLGISSDPFLVFSSNACAILGLRSLFFVISSLMDKFRFLSVGLGVILAFVGLKLIGETYFHDWKQAHENLTIVVSLSVIAVTLTVSIAASALVPPKQKLPKLAEPKPVESTHV